MFRSTRSATTLTTLFVLAACSSGEVRESARSYELEEAPADAINEVPRGAAPSSSRSAAGGSVATDSSSVLGRSTIATSEAQPKPDAQKRLVYYNGYGKLRVTTPAETLEQAVDVVEAVDGYVESFAGDRIVVRVPVEQFRAVFDQLLGLGEVVQRSITAQDITAAFTSTRLRLQPLKTSRDRMIELLAKARTEEEKLTILREIKRLTEQVDQLEMRLKTLSTLASFSRITLEAEPKQQEIYSQSEEPIGAFRWVRNLSPFRKDVAYGQDRLKLEAPKGMVSLDDFEHWMAESADGAQIWSHERDNDPSGDNGFWLATLRMRLGPSFGGVESERVGEFDVLRLVDEGSDGYRYLIAVDADDDELHVVEIYYPSAAHEERYAAAVRSTLEKGEL